MKQTNSEEQRTHPSALKMGGAEAIRGSEEWLNTCFAALVKAILSCQRS